MQREALFNKSERQVAESQLATVQQQLAELQARSSHIQELHKDIQESQGLVKEKDRKVRALQDSAGAWEPNPRLCVCTDNRVVQGGVPAEGGPGSSVSSSGRCHHLLLLLLCSSQ